MRILFAAARRPDGLLISPIAKVLPSEPSTWARRWDAAGTTSRSDDAKPGRHIGTVGPASSTTGGGLGLRRDGRWRGSLGENLSSRSLPARLAGRRRGDG